MTLIEHLVELRNRLVISLIAFGVAFVVCYFFAERIFAFLVEPLYKIIGPDQRLIYTGLTEAFFTYLQIGFFAAAFLSFPIVASQIYMFMAPGLYKNERHAFLPFLIATPFLFFLGGAMAYYFIFPAAWHFFTSFQTTALAGVGPAVTLEQRVGEYLDLSMKLIFAFGLAFQLPVALGLLARAGIVSAAMLASKRKYAIVAIFALAAVITPPDVLSQVGLAIPLLGLYEISIFIARRIEKKRAEREADRDAELS